MASPNSPGSVEACDRDCQANCSQVMKDNEGSDGEKDTQQRKAGVDSYCCHVDQWAQEVVTIKVSSELSLGLRHFLTMSCGYLAYLPETGLLCLLRAWWSCQSRKVDAFRLCVYMGGIRV